MTERKKKHNNAEEEKKKDIGGDVLPGELTLGTPGGEKRGVAAGPQSKRRKREKIFKNKPRLKKSASYRFSEGKRKRLEPCPTQRA